MACWSTPCAETGYERDRCGGIGPTRAAHRRADRSGRRRSAPQRLQRTDTAKTEAGGSGSAQDRGRGLGRPSRTGAAARGAPPRGPERQNGAYPPLPRLHEERAQLLTRLLVLDLEAAGNRCVERELCRLARLDLCFKVVAVQMELYGTVGGYPKPHLIAFINADLARRHAAL